MVNYSVLYMILMHDFFEFSICCMFKSSSIKAYCKTKIDTE